MKDDICLLDHHQRSHGKTITIGLKGMINRVLQLNISQLESSFNSLLEKHLVLNLPNQPNPNPIQSVIERRNPWRWNVFLWRGKTSHSQEIVGKRLQEELGSSDRTGKPVKCEDNRVMNVHDRTVKPVQSSTHTQCKNLVLPDIVILHHQTRTSSTLQSMRKTSTSTSQVVPNSTMKRSHGVNVQNLIQQIENHPKRQALQIDLQQHRAFNPFSKESKDAISAARNTELCEIIDVEPKSQCRACLTYWDVGIVHGTCGHFLRDDTTENKKYISSVLDLFRYPELLHQEGPATR